MASFARWARSWLFTTNHKRIGILYLWTTFVFFLMAGVDGLLLRMELATPRVDQWTPDLYDGLFTVHGTQMVFLFAIPVFSAFANMFLPPMVGAKDMAFPKLNALSWWLVLTSGTVLRVPIFVDVFPTVGWTNYVPLSNAVFSPDLGQDWWIWSIMLETIASTLGGINFLVTVIRERAADIGWMDLRPFVWGMVTASVLAVVNGPFLIGALLFHYVDRAFGSAFFDTATEGGALLWQDLFWFYSHPATYIMILPAFGIMSEVVAAYAGRRLYSYRAMLFGLWGVTLLGLLVWWHHMFVSGQQVGYSVFASVMSFAIAIPTGVLFFNCLATMKGGRVRLTTAMLWALGLIAMFTVGGIDGTYLASIPLDVNLHDTYWLVAHIHFVLFGGTLFGVYAAVYHWFPEMFGRRLGERLGLVHFWATVTGGLMTFVPMHVVGAEGMVRRVWEYPAEYFAWNVVETIGAFLIGAAQVVFLGNVVATLLRVPRAEPEPSYERPRREHIPGRGKVPLPGAGGGGGK